jgi:hypothetical protein
MKQMDERIVNLFHSSAFHTTLYEPLQRHISAKCIDPLKFVYFTINSDVNVESLKRRVVRSVLIGERTSGLDGRTVK